MYCRHVFRIIHPIKQSQQACLGSPHRGVISEGKKSSSISGRATKRGGGGKGGAIKEKRIFFIFCCHLKIKIILL